MHVSRWVYLHLNPVCMLCPYTSLDRIYYLFYGIPSSLLKATPSSFSCFLSWLLFLLLVGLSYFQDVHHMRCISWVSNGNLLNLLVDIFNFSCECVITKKELVTIYLFRNISLLSLFFFVFFSFFQRNFSLWPLLWQYVHYWPYLFLL